MTTIIMDDNDADDDYGIAQRTIRHKVNKRKLDHMVAK